MAINQSLSLKCQFIEVHVWTNEFAHFTHLSEQKVTFSLLQVFSTFRNKLPRGSSTLIIIFIFYNCKFLLSTERPMRTQTIRFIFSFQVSCAGLAVSSGHSTRFGKKKKNGKSKILMVGSDTCLRCHKSPCCCDSTWLSIEHANEAAAERLCKKIDCYLIGPCTTITFSHTTSDMWTWILWHGEKQAWTRVPATKVWIKQPFVDVTGTAQWSSLTLINEWLFLTFPTDMKALAALPNFNKK